MNGTDKVLALTEIKGIRISTVFLGIDHNLLEEGEPVLFETMVFGGEFDGACDRATTWHDAMIHHLNAVTLIANRAYTTKQIELVPSEDET